MLEIIHSSTPSPYGTTHFSFLSLSLSFSFHRFWVCYFVFSFCRVRFFFFLFFNSSLICFELHFIADMHEINVLHSFPSYTYTYVVLKFACMFHHREWTVFFSLVLEQNTKYVKKKTEWTKKTVANKIKRQKKIPYTHGLSLVDSPSLSPPQNVQYTHTVKQQTNSAYI